MSQPAPSPTSSSSLPPPQAGAARHLRVFIFIAAAAILFLITEALLYYRWSTTAEPSCVLVIDASPALKDVEITVSGALTPPLKATIGQSDRYAIPFYVEPGTYEVKLTLQDATFLDTHVSLSRQEPGRRLDFREVHPPAQPATQRSASEIVPLS
jgi:hypothetical protein